MNHPASCRIIQIHVVLRILFSSVQARVNAGGLSNSVGGNIKNRGILSVDIAGNYPTAFLLCQTP